MMIKERQQDNIFDLHSKATLRKTSQEEQTVDMMFVKLTKTFGNSLMTRVQKDVKFSESFDVTNGVKQGCVMAPTPLSMMFCAMLVNASHDRNARVPSKYLFNAKLCNKRTLQTKPKVQTDILHIDQLLYADDIDKKFSSIM